MNPLFSEMLKGFEPWKAWDYSKAMEMMNTSDAARMGVRMIDFQKSAFNTAFDTMLKFQEQSKKVNAIFTSGNQAIPEASRAFLQEWENWLTQNQDQLRSYVTDHYDRMKTLITPNTK